MSVPGKELLTDAGYKAMGFPTLIPDGEIYVLHFRNKVIFDKCYSFFHHERPSRDKLIDDIL